MAAALTQQTRRTVGKSAQAGYMPSEEPDCHKHSFGMRHDQRVYICCSQSRSRCSSF